MPPISVLIKPASSACNMACTYCFYRDVASRREKAFTGMLSVERMETIMVSALEYARGSCTFAFQGGEPTLAGLDFFRQVVQLGKKHRKPGVQISYSLQTNGYCIDEEWARFLGENHFLVGLSLDGPPELHDQNRKGPDGKGSSKQVLQAARLFDQYRVDYNILSVITSRNARAAQSIYNFFKKNQFYYLQFIPCMKPLGAECGSTPYGLSGRRYGKFLVQIFDLWYQDYQKGVPMHIRQLDNWLHILAGYPPELCSMQGRCSIQFVIESDGGVYPCDFYVLDEWRLGTIGEQSFAELVESETAQRFIQESTQIPEECRTCPVYPVCRNGCRRDRVYQPGVLPGKNRYCEAFQYFFKERGLLLSQILRG